MRARVCSRATGAAALLLSSVHGMVQAKVIRVVLELLGGAVAAFCEPQTPPVSLSTTGPEGVIHQLRQHRSCRSCAGARNAVTARLSSGSPKAAHARPRDSTHGRDSVASRAHSALHTCVQARMSLFEEAVGQRFFLGTPSTVATTSLRVRGQAFIFVAWCRPALRSSLLRLLDSLRRFCCSTPLKGPGKCLVPFERKYSAAT